MPKPHTVKPLPKQILVKWETDPNDDDNGYFIAAKHTNDWEDGDLVGVYRLESTKRLKISHDLK